jgi:hypothetical protein
MASARTCLSEVFNGNLPSQATGATGVAFFRKPLRATGEANPGG